MNEEPNDGLREQIARAESPEEITNLLATAGTFTQASERTRRAWRNTAKRRLVDLAKIEAQPVEDEARRARIQGIGISLGGVR